MINKTKVFFFLLGLCAVLLNAITVPSFSINPGWLRIESKPSTATVFLDGKKFGNTPLWAQVKEGKHTIKIVKEGYLPYSASIEISPKKASTVISVVLKKAKYSYGPKNIHGAKGSKSTQKNTITKSSKTKPAKSKSVKKDKNIPTNATIMKFILRKLSSYQTIKYVMENTKDGTKTILKTYYQAPNKIRQDYYPKNSEAKKRTTIISGKRIALIAEGSYVEKPGAPFKLFKINLDKHPAWRPIFEAPAVVKGRKAWQVKFLKEDRSYIRAWFDVLTGVVLRREDYPPKGQTPTFVGVTKELEVNTPIPSSLFAP